MSKNEIEELYKLAQSPHILVIDDDERLRQLLFMFLKSSNFLVTTANDSLDARDKLKYLEFDLVVMDVMMPGEDGISLTESLKKDGFKAPILLLTALDDVNDRIRGLEAGADDYLSKPFEPKELVLRINAILKRVAIAPEVKNKEISFGKWIFDKERGELVAGEERLPLTQAENNLLKALISKDSEIITREDLAEICNLDAAERTIDVQITRLRKKLEEDPKLPKYIQTVRGKGYVLRSDK